MSIKLLSIHEHKINFSYCRKINLDNLQYKISGWYSLEKTEKFELEENDYISLHCTKCNYNYTSEETNINIYTTNEAHELYFNDLGSNVLYTKYKQQIVINYNHYLKNYYLLKNEYKGIVYIGKEKEIRDYLFSEMTKYKDLYDNECSRNRNLKDDSWKKSLEIIGLNSNINRLNTEIKNLNTKSSTDNNKIRTLNEKINEIKNENEEKIKELNIETNNLKKEFQNTEIQIKSEKNKLEQKEKELLELKTKNEELIEKNAKFGIKYNTENGTGDYDIILCVDSIKDLTNKGWTIKYNQKNGKDNYEKSKQNPTIVVGVVGNRNKGKSFLLKKLSQYEIPMGFNVKTEGLSIIYGETGKKNLAVLDSAGQETPLLKKDKIMKFKEDDKEDNSKDQLEFEEYSRDKLITEFYIQQFILWKSSIIILLVGSITLSEQKLYARVKSEVMSIQENKKETKKLYVIHNLLTLEKKDDVNDYIENILKKLYNVELEEIQMYDPNNEITGYDKYFLEKDNKNIIHLLFINDYCENSSYYNKCTIWYLTQAISQEPSRQKFEILEDSRDFLLEISEEIMENKLSKENIEIIIDKETKEEKLIVKDEKEIQLKKFIVDEMGITKNDGNTPKYSYYIDTQKSKLVVNIELPGGGSFEEPEIIPIQGYYSFRLEGEQNGELKPKFENEETKKDYEELDIDKENQASIISSKNLRKKHPIHLEFKISSQVMQLIYLGKNPKYIVENTYKGIIIFIFDIVLLNKSSEVKKQKKKITI